MVRLRASFIVLTLLFAAFLIADKSSAQNIVNGGFETGNFAGWTVIQQPNSGGNWFVYSGNSVPGLPSPPVGSFAANTEQGDPSSQILFQDIFVPVGAEALCSVIVYYNNTAEDFVIGPGLAFALSENQQARIDIISTDADPFTIAAGVLLNIFQTEPGDPLTLGYTTLNFDLSPFAGDTVRFRAAEVDNIGPFNFAIDELTCGGGVITPTNIPTLGEWGMMAMAGVLGIAGLLYARRKRAATV